jgi:hypothetical protein
MAPTNIGRGLGCRSASVDGVGAPFVYASTRAMSRRYVSSAATCARTLHVEGPNLDEVIAGDLRKTGHWAVLAATGCFGADARRRARVSGPSCHGTVDDTKTVYDVNEFISSVSNLMVYH